MPKPKGSPKTGGRKKQEEPSVIFYHKCSPAKKLYLKKCSIDYDKNIKRS